MEFKTTGTLSRKTDGDSAGFVGYASTWTRDPDSYGDVVAKGAFTRTLKEWSEKGLPIPVLWGHRLDDPKFFIGTVKTAKEDDHGLKVGVDLDADSPTAEHVRRLLKSGAVAQMSFAFDVRDSGDVELDDGRKARELRDLRLYEVSVVPIGANQDTSIETVKAPSDGGLTSEEVAQVRALLASQTAPEEGEAGSNTDDAEAPEGQDEDPVKAAARLNTQIAVLFIEGERSAA